MRLLLTIMLLCTAMTCFAQEQVIYYKNNFERVKLKDSADFITVIRMPDAGKDLYKVTEYYKNGKIKLTGESSRPDVAIFQGEQITYSENGVKTTLSNYNNGKLVGFIHEFFPNGKLYLVKDLRKTPSSDDDIMANYDSLGKQLVTNGNGYAKLYAKDLKTLIAEGAVKEGKRDGVWRFNDKDESRVETYSGQKFVEGVLTTATGETIKYTQREIAPEFTGGPSAFSKFLGKNIKYPKYERDNHIQGKVFLSFVVEKDGTLGEMTAARTPSEGLANEALRVLKLSPPWKPGIQYGRPARVQYVVPINFSL
jgi:antitoxin component YwqK of YwqJK toxin-antitoxin module